MAEKTQNATNHARFLPPFHFFAFPILAINFFYVAYEAFRAATLAMAWQALVALALAMVALLARTMALTVQDRVIRLEMRLRLRETLPADLQPRVRELTPRQLIAMR